MTTTIVKGTQRFCQTCGEQCEYRHIYCSPCARKAMLASQKKWRDKVKTETLGQYSPSGYPICNWYGCKETDLKKLCLDHVNGGGRQHMKSIGLYNPETNRIFTGHTFYLWLRRNGYPKNPPLQVLCRKHNQEKQTLYKER